MSFMTIKYKNTPIDVEFSHNQGDEIYIESIEIGGIDVQYLLDSLNEEIELKSLIREQIFNDL
jgi:outer membrane protein assembly factor BamA